MKFIKYLFRELWLSTKDTFEIFLILGVIICIPVGIGWIFNWWLGADLLGVSIIVFLIMAGVFKVFIKYEEYKREGCDD